MLLLFIFFLICTECALFYHSGVRGILALALSVVDCSLDPQVNFADVDQMACAFG